MTASYGTYTIYGVQSGLPGSGPVGLGPLLVPFSDCQNTFTYTGSGGQSYGVPSSPSPLGVAIIPTLASGTLQLNFNAGANFYISTTEPTVIQFDPNHVPTLIEVTPSVAGTVVIQWL